ncbi:MAG: dienelactone hydrolase family protein [Planctomycetaceae bacterium]|nr:dienelactone hydrolase family protein [Planctomycetaceae bacterium]
MRRYCLFGLLALGLFAANSAHAAVQTQTIKYQDGGTECVGFLAWDDAVEGQRPGVLVVHEWWGLNDYARNRAKELAKLGYVAFAADMYGEGKTVEHPQDAGAMAAKVRANVEAWRKRAQAGLAVLTSQPQCDATKLAAIGYCFGGSTALQLAYTGADLDAVATFHAALPTPSDAEAKAVKARVLICHGADDKFIPEEAIKAFKGALDKAAAKYEFVAYPGAVHSFTVPDAGKHNNPGMQYQAAADKDSWDRMTKLFAETLKK